MAAVEVNANYHMLVAQKALEIFANLPEELSTPETVETLKTIFHTRIRAANDIATVKPAVAMTKNATEDFAF